MPAGMEIDIVAGSGLDQLDQVLDRVADRLDRIEGTTGRIKSNVQGTRTSGGSGGGGSRKAAEDRFLSGPNQRLLEIEAQRKRAETLTDAIRREAVLKDLAQAEFRAKRSNILNDRRLAQGDGALNQKGLLELFSDLNGLMGSLKSGNVLGALRGVDRATSRVQFLNTQDGLGGLNAEQKIGRTAIGGRLPVAQVISTASQAAGAGEEAAGAAAGAGSLVLPIAGVVVGLILAAKAAQLFAQETQASAARLHEHGAAAFMAGGYQAAQLRALGVDASGLGGLRDRLSSDGMAQYTAARYGIGPVLPSQYSGDQNDAKLELAVLNAIRQANREGGLNEARRVAGIFGRPGDLDKALVSDRVFNLAGRVGANGEKVDQRYSQGGRDFNRQTELFWEQFDQTKDMTLGPIIRESADALGGFNLMLRGGIEASRGFNAAWDDAVHRIAQLNPFNIINTLNGPAGNASQQTAQDAHTQSNLDLIEAIQGLATTFRKAYGGGPFGDAGRPRAGANDPASMKSYQENVPYMEWPG